MKVTDLSKNGSTSESRINIDSTSPTQGFSNVSQEDNSAVLMNMASGLKERGSRADALIDMAAMDNYRLANETPRKQKMKG